MGEPRQIHSLSVRVVRKGPANFESQAFWPVQPHLLHVTYFGWVRDYLRIGSFQRLNLLHDDNRNWTSFCGLLHIFHHRH